MAFDAFLKIDGITGESTDSKHKDEIDLVSFSFGVSQAGTAGKGGGMGAGKAQFSDLAFSKYTSKASPTLLANCASGKHIKTASLTLRKAGGEQLDFYTVKMSDVIITSFKTSGSPGEDESAREDVALNFSKVEFEYKPQNSDGTLGGAVKGGWDLVSNKIT